MYVHMVTLGSTPAERAVSVIALEISGVLSKCDDLSRSKSLVGLQ